MNKVILHEVGLPDGLQIGEATVPTDRTLDRLARLMASGVDLVQVGSSVNPKRVAQMADIDEVFRRLARTSVPPVRFDRAARPTHAEGDPAV